jgi:hypothetical protein
MLITKGFLRSKEEVTRRLAAISRDCLRTHVNIYYTYAQLDYSIGRPA